MLRFLQLKSVGIRNFNWLNCVLFFQLIFVGLILFKFPYLCKKVAISILKYNWIRGYLKKEADLLNQKF